jgi:plastocyanin
MKKLIAAATASVLAAGVLAGPSLAGSTTKTVKVKDNVFSPTSITVKRGTKVKWVWKGSAPHNVTVTKGPVRFSSKTKTSGSFSKTLKRKGTYKIVCTIHAPGMKMTIHVK